MATNTVFIITNTAGVPIAAIQPNTLNGPQGVQQSSDLAMFGLGYALWGQASDQNDYRLVENFACDQSSLPGPIHPKGSDELGNGNGINVPLVGQMWFNTTDQKMYVYTESSPSVFTWETVANNIVVVSSGPANPAIGVVGQLFYNTTLPQLEVWNGSNWDSVAKRYLPLSGGTMTAAFSMGSHKITSLANPVNPFDAATKQYVDTVASGSGVGIFVPLAGGTMTGTLNMSGSANISITSGQLTTGGNVTLTGGTLSVNSGSGQVVNVNGGRIGGLSNTVVALTDAINSNTGDARWLNKTSGLQTVTAPVTFNGPTQVTTTPVSNNDVANKAYVDSSPGFPIFVTPVAVYQSPGGFILNGNVGTVTYVNTWQSVNVNTLLGLAPGTAKAVILEASWVPTTRGDGDQTNQSSIYQGFIFISNNNTGRPSNYTAITSQYILARGQTAEYKYFNATATTNQGVFPVRNSIHNPDGGTIGTFDYLLPSPFGGAGGFYGVGFRIVGYYS